MSSQRPVYIPRRRKAAQSSNSSGSNNSNSNNTDPTSASKSTGLDYQTRRERQKQQQPRFHGAFTGGFSAGYFNTVGTKEGWTPSEVKNKDQRLEDFMDDEDHASWGGPTRVRDEYGAKNKVAATPAALTETSMKDHHDSDPTTTSGGDVASSLQQSSSRTPFLPVTYMLEISHQTVGPRLLRRLGWREGGIAIVPENETTSTSNNPAAAGTANDDDVNKNTLENLAKVHLSRRKLRKIQVRSSRIKLPTPKLDQCGLGFEPYKNAPEFQRYRDKRKQQARDRASYNTKVNVYRISDVAVAPVESNTNSHGAAGRLAASSQDNNGGEYLSYETAEDFVGKRSSAGFALRDDEDDAYDDDVIYNHSKQLGRINDGEPQSSRPSTFKVGDEYNTEVYEHESSDDDEYNISTAGLTSNSLSSISRGGVDKHDQSLASANNNKTTATNNKNKSVDVGNMFAAWAGIDQSSREGKASSTLNDAAVTSDGQPPLAGFVLGNCVDKNNQRYSGPDIPRDYTIQRHEFGEHENPYVLEAISNAVRLEQKEERNSQIRQQQQQLQQQLQLHQESQRQIMQHRGDESSSRPLSKNFSSLGEAMKRRFTASSTGEGSKKGESSTTKTSTTLPTGLHLPRPVENKDNSSKDIKSLHSNVTITRTVKSFFPNPLICKRFRVPVPTNVKRNAGLIATIEEKKNKESAYFQREILGKSKQQQENKKRSVQNMDDTGNAKSDENQTNEEEAPKGIDRPAIENLRSIFQPSSDESSSSSDDDESDDGGEKTSIDLDQSQKDDSNYSKEDKQSPALSSEGSPAKDGLGGGSREIVEYRPSLSQDELENFSSRSSDSDDEYLSSRKRRKEKRRRKHRHHSRKRHKRKRSRSIDRDGDSDRSSSHEETEDEKQQKEHRSREHKRRKKKKSSRHKSRKREKCESK